MMDPTQMETKECFFFDAGNTLIHLDPSMEQLIVEALEEHGLGVTLIQVKGALLLIESTLSFAGMTLLPAEEWRGFWKRYAGMLTEYLGIDLDEEELARSLSTKFNSPESWDVFPDVEPTLDSLRRSGCRLGVISNAQRRLKDTLRELGLAGYFEEVITSEEAGSEKPDRGIFATALERMGVPPERCVHTGDLLEVDVKGAREAGITSVWLDRLRLGKKVEGVLRVHTLSDLPLMFRLPE